VSKVTHTIELLAPAGSPEALDAAVGEGADAVYLGLKDFNARLRSANFAYSQFESALRTLRRMGKKIYVTVNTVFEQREADRMYQMLKYLANQGPDAIIVQDFGVVAMVRAEFPSLRLHASTQMNIASARGANALSRHGISRVVLARELSLEELKSIRFETNLELEVFVHGALCVSASGICLFSSFLGGKSANRGMCTQACRRLYQNGSAGNEGVSGYYFSPNDLQLLEHLPDLAAAGINSLKIEGRMKSAAYVGAVVSAYRMVADAVAHGDEDQIRRSIEQGRKILRNDFARPKTQFYFNRDALQAGADINWLNPGQDGGTGISLGKIIRVKGAQKQHGEAAERRAFGENSGNSEAGGSGGAGAGSEKRALISPPAGIIPSAGDSVRIHSSDDSGRITHKVVSVQKADKSLAYNGFWISAPECSIGDSVYLIQTKAMSKRYAPVIAQGHASRGPGREKAPSPQVQITQHKEGTNKRGKSGASFPEGLYVAVHRPEDLYIVQSSRPQKVMLAYSQKNVKYLLADNKPPLPFKPAEIILNLDPYFPQGAPAYNTHKIAEEIEQLIDMGYVQYTLNNPGHFSLFRGHDNVKLIAGPWLYIFNSWSLSFVSSLASNNHSGVEGYVSPLENNRQNLERTLAGISCYGREKQSLDSQKGKLYAKKRQSSNLLHSKVFITVFAWPPLFNIRADLGTVFEKTMFKDNNGDFFSLITGPEGSRIYPEKAFSIIDKIPFLKQAGFSRFIIDLSGPLLKKSAYRDLMRSVEENAHLPQTSRFNWKNGFFSQ